MIVSNSSPLIFFGKQGKLSLLKTCFKQVLIPRGVYDEISKSEDTSETIALMEAIEDKWVRIEDIKINKALETDNIGKGEREAISLAHKNKSLLLIDDDNARRYAEILNVEVHGTLYVILLSCSKKFITKSEAKDILEGMILDGFYISVEVYSRFLSLLGYLK